MTNCCSRGASNTKPTESKWVSETQHTASFPKLEVRSAANPRVYPDVLGQEKTSKDSAYAKSLSEGAEYSTAEDALIQYLHDHLEFPKYSPTVLSRAKPQLERPDKSQVTADLHKSTPGSTHTPVNLLLGNPHCQTSFTPSPQIQPAHHFRLQPPRTSPPLHMRINTNCWEIQDQAIPVIDRRRGIAGSEH